MKYIIKHEIYNKRACNLTICYGVNVVCDGLMTLIDNFQGTIQVIKDGGILIKNYI